MSGGQPDEPVVFMRVESSRLVNGQLLRDIEFGVERDGKFVSNGQLEIERAEKEAESKKEASPQA